MKSKDQLVSSLSMEVSIRKKELTALTTFIGTDDFCKLEQQSKALLRKQADLMQGLYLTILERYLLAVEDFVQSEVKGYKQALKNEEGKDTINTSKKD